MFPVAIIKPRNLNELWKILPGVAAPRKYLAGGTDLCISARHGKCVDCDWIDISSLPELQKIEETKPKLFIGSGVKIAALGKNPLVAKWAPVLYDASSKFASPPLRNMATLGGNCANASPSADGVCALYAENAVAVLAHFGRIRRIPVGKISIGPKKNSLKDDELILGFEIPKTPHTGAYLKLAAREKFAISKIAMGFALWQSDSVIDDVRISLGAVAPTVLRARKTEDYLRGRKISETVIEKAKEIITGENCPIDDQRSTAAYRNAMTAVLLGRCLGALRT